MSLPSEPQSNPEFSSLTTTEPGAEGPNSASVVATEPLSNPVDGSSEATHEDEKTASACSPLDAIKRSTGGTRQPKKLVRAIEYRNLKSDNTVLKQELDSKEVEERRLDQPGLEIVEVVFTTLEKAQDPQTDDEDDGTSKHKRRRTLPPVRIKGYHTIRIRSPAVLNALEHVVNYYPGHEIAGEMYQIDSPFAIIVHHEQQLREFRDALASEEPVDISDRCQNKDGVEMLDLLLDEVQSHHGDGIEREKERYNQEIPTATFDMIWLLLEPGTDVYYDNSETNEYWPCVVSSVEFSTREGKISSDIVVWMWSMCGDDMYVGASNLYNVVIERFNGEKAITSINPFPCRFFTGDGNETPRARWKRVVERGKVFFNLRLPKCMWFDGLSYRCPQRKYTGYVMVDPDQFFLADSDATNLDAKRGFGRGVEDLAGGGQKCQCQRCLKLFGGDSKKPKFAGYSKINPLKTTELTEHQYFLCVPYTEAFVFKLRQWVTLQIDGFSDPQFHGEIFDDLILPPAQKRMISHLSETHMNNLAAKDAGEPLAWVPDPLEERGQGMIFLLHGGPGVGKTYTAECIAQRLSRPLMVLTVADIGTDPEAIERNLDKKFKLSRAWNTVLLIDEADIYLEERQTMDLTRNAIVAAFLRALEYYDGIMFLTTNRVATFDDAILSRVHLMVGYKDFSDDDRSRLWDTLFKRLHRDNEDTLRVHRDAQSYVLEDKEITGLKWNGREIRNAFQTAVTLAIAEGQKDKNGITLIQEEHFKSIVKMSSAFKSYLRDFSGGKTERQIARMKGKR